MVRYFPHLFLPSPVLDRSLEYGILLNDASPFVPFPEDPSSRNT